jgi:hypothetical protein
VNCFDDVIDRGAALSNAFSNGIEGTHTSILLVGSCKISPLNSCAYVTSCNCMGEEALSKVQVFTWAEWRLQ